MWLGCPKSPKLELKIVAYLPCDLADSIPPSAI
jgi:hypothetical protein